MSTSTNSKKKNNKKITLLTSEQEAARKNAVLFEHIEAAMEAVEQILEDTKNESEEYRRNMLKGSLFYWLSQVFDDAQPAIKDLKTALETSQAIIEKYERKEQLLKDEEV